MAFLHIALLAGAGLVVAPIVLHLVMRQKPRRLEFPALRFIAERSLANRRQLRLRHLLLLALRCAIICLIAFALARPTIQATGMLGDREAPVAAALVFDTQPHMHYRYRDQTRLEAAQDTAGWLLGQLPSDSEVAVLDGHASSATFSADLSVARRRVERLDKSPLGPSLARSIEDALRLVRASEKLRKEVYIFTDLAESSWPTDATDRLSTELQQAQDVALYVIDVGVKDPQDAGLGDLRLSAQALSASAPVRIETDVYATGADVDRAVGLYILDAHGKGINRGQESLQLKPHESQRVEFRVGSLGPGVHQGYLKMAGEDGLAADDTRFFTVLVKPAWRVLVVAPTTADPRQPNRQRTAKAYTWYLPEALAPYEWRVKGEAAFQCEVIDVAELGRKKLEEYQAVCLLDPTPLSDDAWSRLESFARAGGGVAIFLGHNARLAEFNAAPAQALLPGPLVRRQRAPDGDVYLAPNDLAHPVLTKFRANETAIPWDDSPVLEFWRLGPLAKDAHLIVPYSNGQPALVERPVGRGRAITMTTSVSDDLASDPWNQLPADPQFFKLLNESFFYLVGARDARLNFLAGDRVVLRFDSTKPHSIFSLTSPNGDQTRVTADERQGTLEIEATDMPGNYLARAGGEEGVELGFSVNLSAESCRLDPISDERLKAIFGDASFRLAHSREEIDRSVNMVRMGRELYPILILLLVLAFAAEQVLSNRFYGSDRKDEATKRSKKSFESALAGFGVGEGTRAAAHEAGGATVTPTEGAMARKA